MTLRRKFERFRTGRELERERERQAFREQYSKELLKKHERRKKLALERGIERAKRKAEPTSIKFQRTATHLRKGVKTASKQLQGFGGGYARGFPLLDVPDMGFGTRPKRRRKKEFDFGI
jgi:hypothetical protein